MSDRNELLKLSRALEQELDQHWPTPGDADALYQYPLLVLQKWRKLLERSIALSARRNVPGQPTFPVLWLVDVLRWLRDYDCSSEQFMAWLKYDDRLHEDWLEWHARFYGYERPTIADTVARLEALDWTAQRGGGDG